LKNNQSDYFSKSNLNSPRFKGQAITVEKAPPAKTIDFDYSDFTQFDKAIMQQLVAEKFINVEDTLIMSKQKLGKEDKSLKIFNPSKKVQRKIDAIEKLNKVSFMPTPSSPNRSAKQSLQLDKVINSLQMSNKLRNKF
jgi:hypothetical protein